MLFWMRWSILIEVNRRWKGVKGTIQRLVGREGEEGLSRGYV